MREIPAGRTVVSASEMSNWWSMFTVLLARKQDTYELGDHIAESVVRTAAGVSDASAAGGFDHIIAPAKRLGDWAATPRDWKTIDHATLTMLRDLISNVLGPYIECFNGPRLFLAKGADLELLAADGDYFSSATTAAFPSAVPDLIEAAACVAHNRWTAAVMHSMRGAEIALRALQGDLRVEVPKENWGAMLDQIEKAIREGALTKAEQDWYSGAALHFRFLKDAWRNHAMHAGEMYAEGDARMIFEHTKSLMEYLAAKITEADA